LSVILQINFTQIPLISQILLNTAAVSIPTGGRKICEIRGDAGNLRYQRNLRETNHPALTLIPQMTVALPEFGPRWKI